MELPVTSSASLIGRVSRWSAGGYSKPRVETSSPHLLFMALRDGGSPATSLGWASPIRTHQGPIPGRWAKHGGDQTNRRDRGLESAPYREARCSSSSSPRSSTPVRTSPFSPPIPPQNEDARPLMIRSHASVQAAPLGAGGEGRVPVTPNCAEAA
jgi:hypothetical protein